MNSPTNSPKDYLTDRLAQFDKQFVAQQGKKKVWWVDDPLRVKAFLTETIQQSMEVGREKEVCICAAIKMPDGYIVKGHRHNDCFRTIYGIERYKKIGQMEVEDGFITTKNRFVDRKEGLKLQLAAGIKSADREGSYRGDELYSEDLY